MLLRFLRRFLRKLFAKKADAKGRPLVCTKCGDRRFNEVVTDYAGHSVACEADVFCVRCGSKEAVYLYGIYCHVKDKY